MAKFIEKLRALSENQKIAIIAVVVVIAGLIMGYFWVISAARSISKIGDSLQSADITDQIKIPQEAQDALNNVGQSANSAAGAVNSASQAIDTANWQTYTNTDYGFTMKYPLDWNLDKDHTSSLEFHLTKNVDQEQALVDQEVVSQTQKITSAQVAIDKVVQRMKTVVQPKTEVTIGTKTGYEAIGTLCTAVCNGSPDDVYSLFSIIYLSDGKQVFYFDYVEGISGKGWETDMKDWKYYSDFKNMLSTFTFTDSVSSK